MLLSADAWLCCCSRVDREKGASALRRDPRSRVASAPTLSLLRSCSTQPRRPFLDHHFLSSSPANDIVMVPSYSSAPPSRAELNFIPGRSCRNTETRQRLLSIRSPADSGDAVILHFSGSPVSYFLFVAGTLGERVANPICFVSPFAPPAASISCRDPEGGLSAPGNMVHGGQESMRRTDRSICRNP